MEGVGPLFLSLRGLRGSLYFCIISSEKLVQGVELIMLKMRMMGRCLILILLSSVVILITAGKYKLNERKLFLEIYFRNELGSDCVL